MAPIIYMAQTIIWMAHNDSARVEQITKTVTRAENVNGIRYLVVES